MKNFTYFRPTSLEQAVGLLENRWGNTELLAGGTDLHDLQKEYVAQPARVVSLNGIKGLAAIETDAQNPARWTKLGAGAKIAEIRGHVGPRGRRTVELAKFFHAPSNAGEREHTLAPNEVLVSVTVPARGLASASYEVRQKQSYDWPVAQAAVAFTLNNGKTSGARVVLG